MSAAIAMTGGASPTSPNAGQAADDSTAGGVTAASGASPAGTSVTSHGIVRYDLVRDTGTDAAPVPVPVPQYLTYATPAKPADVPQHSEVAAGFRQTPLPA